MFSIKESFADCFSCPLLECKSCILETNCKDNLEKVDIVFVAENPGKDEVEAERPLVGKAGKTFRQFFNKYHLNKTNYLLTNVVLCQTVNPDGTTGNPEDEVIERCKINCMNIIKTCKPKLIVMMGASPMKAFGIAKSGITNLRGKLYKWEDYDVFLTVHPSYVNRNRDYLPDFEKDLKDVSIMMGIKSNDETIQSQEISSNTKGVHYFKLPEKYYTKDYRLVDIQHLHRTSEILYIFRDKDNKKVYYKTDDEFVCYQVPKDLEAKKVMRYDDLEQIKIKNKDRARLQNKKIMYEEDLALSVKRSIDYYLLNKEECIDTDLNIMDLDIEVYTGDAREFPHANQAKYPICMLTYYYHNQFRTYVLQRKSLIKDFKLEENIKNPNVIACKSEKELMNNFIKDFHSLDPDFVVGWNVLDFDLQYIYNRCKKLGINPDSLSKFNEVSLDEKSWYPSIAGTILLDKLRLYKEFSQNKKESYRLDFIAQEEIKKGKTEDVTGNFNKVYSEDLDLAIKYNINDVLLTVELESKLKHITLMNELRKVTKGNFRSANNVMGRLDSLITSFLKENGLASKNSEQREKSDKFEGAYVKEPKVGVHDYIVDFDFTSLYPSLILTYNIGLNTFVMKFKDGYLGYDFIYDRNKLPEKIDLILDPLYTQKEVSMTKEELIKKVENEKLIYTVSGCFFRNHSDEISFYGQVLNFLLSSRKVYKNKMFEAEKMKHEEELKVFKTKQEVYKILANAMYGVLGNSSYRFFNLDCARSVTMSGQEALKTSMLESEVFIHNLINKENKEVVPVNKSEMYGNLENRKFDYIITGDTDSLFCCLKKAIDTKSEEDDILLNINTICSSIQNYLNTQVLDKLVSKHNCDLKYNRLMLKNEFIIKRGLFLAKKRYALKLVSQEGVKIDKMDFKGVEMRRSDYPSYTKKILSEIIDKLLNSKTVSLRQMNDFINLQNSVFLDLVQKGSKVIARPASFTRDLEEYKVLSQGVIGMTNWNELEYDHFTQGTKGYLFKILGINEDECPKKVYDNYVKNFVMKSKKLELITIPDDLDFLPPYYQIDLKATLQFCWKDRYELLLKPLYVADVKKKEINLEF